MLISSPQLALLALLPLSHALPDFSCICESHNLNGCSKAYSCRLNSTIDFYKTPVPDWVTDAEEALFVNTIDDAVNGLLRPPFFSLGRMTWEATIACDSDDSADGELAWFQQLSQCQRPTVTVGNVTRARRRYHGWASLGFHPLVGTGGKQPGGTWLTQIMGEIDDPDADDDRVGGELARAGCADTGLYVSVDYINATQPYDPRFEPAGNWGMLYLHSGGRTYPVGERGVPSYRTDGDLVENGVVLNCTGYDTSGRPCVEPRCFEPANVRHYGCEVGRNASVGAGECRRRYVAVADDSGAAGMGRWGGGEVWVWVGVAVALVLGMGVGM
ncbi:hypothetical protein CONLIGDRAFT_675854 [Coniochaeta ligniaria NRRL 30616]|uniref:Uncharacterized protein n=1 Tax=Coniochaeta ligniaria NRRL 30616 TaxID=1408157 RepID=A0A1J7J544_9PEZI|nr:hypothetical protein CONLIGDRAFT_675854 [Coniochaeta ligniaria NRRL 30616]